ncbi:MAG TPA: nuclear transport factor 2 family protein [Pseudonocardiaceae bacterium]
MSEARSAREVVELMRAGRYGEDGAQFAPDAVYETPFGLPGAPRRFEGIDAINAHFAARLADPLAAAMATLDVTERTATVHDTDDPGVVVFELAMAGTSKTTGEPFRFTASLGVLTVRAGRITHWRDFPNFVGAAETTGALPTLAAMLTGA